jgi:hypothetical protein
MDDLPNIMANTIAFIIVSIIPSTSPTSWMSFIHKFHFMHMDEVHPVFIHDVVRKGSKKVL